MKHLIAAILCCFAVSSFGQDAPKPSELVVHEWGVMIGASGDELFAADAASAPVDDLPGFVEKCPTRPLPLPRHVMSARKPVLYFYGPEGLTFDVRVDVPQGYPFAWWPKADEATFEAPKPKPKPGEKPMPPAFGGGTQNMGGHLLWKNVKLASKAGALKDVDAKHWIAEARNPAAMYVDAGGASERFLFYEALTLYSGAPMIRADGADGLLIGGQLQHVKAAIAIQVNDGKLSMAVIDDVTKNPADVEIRHGNGPVKFRRYELKADAKALDAVATLLKDAGLNDDEAASVAKIWEPDFLKREGSRLLYVLPEAQFNALLPLKITPAPKELKRVMLMSVEALSTDELTAASKLKDAVAASNDADAQKKLAGYGRRVVWELMTNWANYAPKGQQNLSRLYMQLEGTLR